MSYTDPQIKQLMSNMAHGRLPGGFLVATVLTAIGGVETDIIGLTTGSIFIPPNRLIKITGHGQVNNDATPGKFTGRVRQDGVEIGRFALVDMPNSAGGIDQIADGCTVLSPPTGNHVYKLTGIKGGGGTCTWIGNAPTIIPAFILVEDIGPA